MTPWRDDQVRRYSRHMLLTEVGGVGQRAILNAEVALEIGAAAADVAFAYLVGAGVGTIAVSGELDAPPTDAEIAGSIVYQRSDRARTRFGALVDYARVHNPDVAVVRHCAGATGLVVDRGVTSLARAHVVGGAAAARFLIDVIAATRAGSAPQ